MSEYIDREAAIITAEQYGLGDGRVLGRHSGIADCIASEIATLPAADVIPRLRWIPADEELPPEGIDVLCWYEYFRYGGYNRMHQTFGIGYRFCGHWGGEVAQGRDAKVLAWIPLPEPPEMDGGADNG